MRNIRKAPIQRSTAMAAKILHLRGVRGTLSTPQSVKAEKNNSSDVEVTAAAIGARSVSQGQPMARDYRHTLIAIRRFPAHSRNTRWTHRTRQADRATSLQDHGKIEMPEETAQNPKPAGGRTRIERVAREASGDSRHITRDGNTRRLANTRAACRACLHNQLRRSRSVVTRR